MEGDWIIFNVWPYFLISRLRLISYNNILISSKGMGHKLELPLERGGGYEYKIHV